MKMIPKNKRLLLQKKLSMREQIAKLREMIYGTHSMPLDGPRSLRKSKEDRHGQADAPKWGQPSLHDRENVGRDGTGRVQQQNGEPKKCRRTL